MRHKFHAICPYFAMFPEQFAAKWIEATTRPGDMVLDPFSGRGTTGLEALLRDREFLGGDVNPVAYVLSGAKVMTPAFASVWRRLKVLEDRAREQSSTVSLPESEFFQYAFDRETLRTLVFLRGALRWRHLDTDRFIAALCLGSLHGEMDKSHSYFSNQMPRTISTKPGYSVGFWKARGLQAPRRDVFAILRQRLQLRFQSEPPPKRGNVLHCDVRHIALEAKSSMGRVRSVITSPPYLDVTSYEEDQWLRLWFLGGTERPKRGAFANDDRHETVDRYWLFLCDAWRGIRPLLKSKAHVVVRIGGKGAEPLQLTRTLSASMRFLGRRAELVSSDLSSFPRRQTEVFRPGSQGCKFELDCHFRVSQ